MLENDFGNDHPSYLNSSIGKFSICKTVQLVDPTRFESFFKSNRSFLKTFPKTSHTFLVGFKRKWTCQLLPQNRVNIFRRSFEIQRGFPHLRRYFIYSLAGWNSLELSLTQSHEIGWDSILPKRLLPKWLNYPYLKCKLIN
jgi:hypothetical protein